MVKFLKKASSNLRAPFSVIVPNHKLPLRERRRMLAKQLAEFVMLYRKVREAKHCSSVFKTEKVMDVNLAVHSMRLCITHSVHSLLDVGCYHNTGDFGSGQS